MLTLGGGAVHRVNVSSSAVFEKKPPLTFQPSTQNNYLQSFTHNSFPHCIQIITQKKRTMLYLLVLIKITTLVVGEEIGIDWWNILNADATCCPGHTSEVDCLNEGGSSCIWFEKPNNAIAAAAGSQCVGQSYVVCKRRNGITACCSPNCNNIPGNPNNPPVGGPAPGNTPVCGPKTTTSRPTPRPTPNPTPYPTPQPTLPCTLGIDYQFEGGSCKISGDPHTTIFNGNKHDFQGTPTVITQGFKRNQFYYIHPCAGESHDAMPLKVAGTHYHWGTRSVSGTKYRI